MCQYQRAPQCSSEMHSAKMCRECYLERSRERSRDYHRRHSNNTQPLTIGQMIELHKNSARVRPWV